MSLPLREFMDHPRGKEILKIAFEVESLLGGKCSENNGRWKNKREFAVMISRKRGRITAYPWRVKLEGF